MCFEYYVGGSFGSIVDALASHRAATWMLRMRMMLSEI